MIERMFYIYTIIKNASSYITAQQIKETLENDYDEHLDIKTVYQMIKNINDFYHLMTGKQLIEAIKRKGYTIKDDYFEDGQLQYLLDSIVYNHNLSENEANLLINQLQNLSSTKQLSRLQLQEGQQDSQDYQLLLNLTTILKAIHHQKPIYFQYVNYQVEGDHFQEVAHSHGNDKNDVHNYIVSPYRLVLRNSKYYLIGYFSLRPDHLSIYRLDRMRLVRNHHSLFEDISDQFDLDKEIQRCINMYMSGYNDTLQIRFDQSVIREVVAQFGKSRKVKQIFDQRYELTIDDTLISEGLKGWLFMLQDHVEVVMPLDLKEEMKVSLEKMYNYYK